jgi:membrane glycosyltransferase
MAPRRDPRRAPRAPWDAAGARRRMLLFALIAGQTAVATYFMSGVLPYDGSKPLEAAILIVFALLFAWVSAGFWTALAGFCVLIVGGDRYALSARRAGAAPIDPSARTAIVVPICNENVQRVFAGLRATYRSLERCGTLEHFDFFVLSDSTDPDTRVAEVQAWQDLSRVLDAQGRLFYRWRRHRIKKKAGNVADFCRRWGRNYRYMVVFDADSVMSGECLAALVRLMEAHPDAGIIQTAPRAVGRETLYARVQQFAGRVYGPLFAAGMHYWQLGEAHYWGHNAIIRVAPFIEHCALARLPGSGVLSGEILSHDFVEAAFMRRAGYGVWLAYDLPGSYEETPPSLLDEVKRDRRWCRGNLINARLIAAPGIHPAHRALFLTGLMAYLSAPLWALFLALSTALVAVNALVPPSYFLEPRQLFPIWPAWNLAWALGLLGATGVLLFVPKVLALLVVLFRNPQDFGGPIRAALSVLFESSLSALLAPVRMLFHTQFVLSVLSAFAVRWKSPPREDAETDWRYAARAHAWQSALGLAWALGVYLLDPEFLPWLVPVAGALLVAIPVSVLTSRVSFGRRLRELGLFLIPEEKRPPGELATVAASLRLRRRYARFVDAVLDPRVNAAVCASRVVSHAQPVAASARRQGQVEHALRAGPHGLDTAARLALLADPVVLNRVHNELHRALAAYDAWYRTENRGQSPISHAAVKPKLALR